MTAKTYTETEIADLMSRFGSEVESVTDHREPYDSRRTQIVPEVPAHGFAVSIAGVSVRVDAATRGDAILDAASVLRATGHVPDALAYVFMWQFIVTDADGVTVFGHDMHEDVQVARIARQMGGIVQR